MIDLSHWNYATDFTGEAAAALAVGLDPAQPEYRRTGSNPIYERMERHFNEAKRLCQEDVQQWDGPPLMNKSEVLESIDLQRLCTDEDPEDGAYFQRWFRDEKLSGFDTQRFTRQEMARWLLEVGIPSRYQFSSVITDTSEKMGQSATTKERLSLLKLVIGMAIRGYNYEPGAEKNNATKDIVDDLAALGISITDETVLKYLREAEQKVLPKTLPKT